MLKSVQPLEILNVDIDTMSECGHGIKKVVRFQYF